MRSWLHRTADAAKCSTAVPEYFGHRLPDSAETAKEPKQILGTNPEDDYDGYYNDVLPADEGWFSEGMDKNLIKKVIVIIGAVLLIVALCVGMMYVL